MKDYYKRVAIIISLSCCLSTLKAEMCSTANDFTAETVENFNHEGYRDASMEAGCDLQESFDVAECIAVDGCNILDAAAAKAAFASQRYLQASIAFNEAASIYKQSGYEETATLLEEAARVAESGYLAFKSLSTFDAAGVEAMSVSSYDGLKEMFLHIDPIYLNACKNSAKAFASAVGNDFFIKEVVQASAYTHSAAAAAFRAYQFFYAGIDDGDASRSAHTVSWSTWFWGILGY